MNACLNCGAPLVRKGRTGPPPSKWCSSRCYGIGSKRRWRLEHEAAERQRFALLAALLDELAPMGLTPDCPAQRNLARDWTPAGQRTDGPGSPTAPSAARALNGRPGVTPDAIEEKCAASGVDLEEARA